MTAMKADGPDMPDVRPRVLTWQARAIQAWRAQAAAEGATVRDRYPGFELLVERVPEHLRTACLWMGERGAPGWHELPEAAIVDLAYEEQDLAEDAGPAVPAVPAEAIIALAKWMGEETLP